MFAMKFSTKSAINDKKPTQPTMAKRQIISLPPKNITNLMMERPKRCGACNGAK